ncbi:hypothetical protein Tco_0393789 [Tanacetum coccineum]
MIVLFQVVTHLTALNLQALSVLCTNFSNRVLALESIKDAQAAEISALKSRIKKLEKKCKPSISHHRAWLKSVKRLSMTKRFRKKESVSKQGRKKSKPESTLDDSTVFDDQDADHSMEYMETEEAVDEGRQSGETEEVKLTDDTEVVEDKGGGDKRGNAEELVSTARPKVSTARPDIDAARQEDSAVEPRTPPTTTMSIKDVDDSSRPARSILTLKPLLIIDPKDKGKKIARQLQEDLQAEVERERQWEKEASKAAIAEIYDEVQAGIDADALFAAKLQQEEREEYTIEERAKFLAEIIATQRKFRAAQRSAEIRSADKSKITRKQSNQGKPWTTRNQKSTKPKPRNVKPQPNINAARKEDSAVKPRTPPTTTNVEDSSRLARSTLTLKPLPTIDAKDKGKSVLEEPEPAKKMTRNDFDAAQITRDAEIARQLQVDLQAEVERERQKEEEASKATIAEMYDEVQARIDADALAAQRYAEIRSRLPTKSQLRNLMMTYLKNMGGYKHSQLKAKSFEEIKGMYERQKKFVQDFMPIGSERDKRMIDKMNKKATDEDTSNREEVPEEPVSTKVEVKQEGTKKRKLSTRKKMKSRKRRFRQGTSKGDKTDSDIEKENDELRLCLTIASDEDKEVNYEMLDKKYHIIEWKSKYHGIKPQFDETKDLEEININVVIRSNGQRRYFSTLMRVLSIFDREDLCVVYQLVMNRYQDETPEGFDRILWGDLMIMFNPTDKDEFWNSQQDWNVKYPLRKKVLLQMLELKLESEEDNTMALELIRFIKKLIAYNEVLAIPEQTATGEDCWVLEDSTTYCYWFNIDAASEDLVLLRKIEENRLSL